MKTSLFALIYVEFFYWVFAFSWFGLIYRRMKILGIETSCDETAASVVTDEREILSNVVLSQIDEHKSYGGVVPEIAARAHLNYLDDVIRRALDDAKVDFSDLDAIAATCGPGLIGGVMVGMMAGKAIASAHGKPFIAVNHLEGHALTPRLTDNVAFPYLLLLVSGGHTQILVAEAVGKYRRLGTTVDDAMGEAFDKTAKLMGLPYPGGPELEKIALECDDTKATMKRFPLPRPMKGREELNFSFSGLKTAVRNHVDKLEGEMLERADVAMLAHGFQEACADVVRDRMKRAIALFKVEYADRYDVPTIVIAGGVAANKVLRCALEDLAREHEMAVAWPPIGLCSDNGAMIAWAGLERFRLGLVDGLDFKARPRWPLDEL